MLILCSYYGIKVAVAVIKLILHALHGVHCVPLYVRLFQEKNSRFS